MHAKTYGCDRDKIGVWHVIDSIRGGTRCRRRRNVGEKQGDHWELKDDSGSADGGDEPTKGELYEKAGQRDISGRSKMSKDELQKAVQKGS